MNSLWHKTATLPRFPALTDSTSTDVLIIGGGLAGILTAYFLRRKGVECLLLERSQICSGTTGNTTGKITVQHGLIYQKLIKTYGFQAAKEYLSANRTALEYYSELCRDIDCDYEIKDNFVYSLTDERKLRNEVDVLRKLGQTAHYCREIPLPLPVKGAARVPNQAQFHPLKFVSAIASDLPIYENTWVREFKTNRVVTDYGEIRARRIIVATHFPILNKHGLYFLKQYQHRSYVIALKDAGETDGMYVDEDHSGLSFRASGEYLLLGGGGHRTGKRGGSWNSLRQFASRHYPQSSEVFAWAAQDCMSLDGIPYIGTYSESLPDCYVISGFNKWGMTGSMVAALLLQDLIYGQKKYSFSHIFHPSRSILHPQLLINGVESTVNLFTPTTKRCPHLGCALKWNAAEQSWDCPCHGSRFDASGALLENPANGDFNVKK